MSRVVLALGGPVINLFVPVLVLHEARFEEVYFLVKIINFPIGVLPILLFTFSRQDSPFMAAIVAINVCIGAFYDSFLNAIGIGYYENGFSMPGYYGLQFNFFISYVYVLLCFFFLKKQNEQALMRNENLIENLRKANQVIENQNAELNERSESLEVSVLEKTRHLQDTNAQLMNRIEEMNQFSYAVSHHLRGPLASLKGLLHLLELEVKSDAVSLVKKSAEDLDDVIHDLNYILLLKEKKESFETIDIRSLAENMFSRFVAPVGFEFEVNVRGNVRIFSSFVWLNDILREFISNSIKFRMPGKNLKISLTAFYHDDKCVFEFSDNGIGFASDKVQQRLFQMFQRYHLNISGKGLGLYLAASKVKLLKGQIHIASKPLQGTRIKLELPTNSDLVTIEKRALNG
jgi:signal transduction histidine kinase